eukprot:TRINITY_DN3228_c0_g1_i1.p1 TRINITY_DN3228_c0_g1~~TRINITY_DN3228_c0_g1_i1.p1  ORF type:complete len:676 (+),score=191.65 TRINITY_DN3228_c0_g1_i1:135-2030(+)
MEVAETPSEEGAGRSKHSNTIDTETLNILLLGPPGSGKSTVSSNLHQKYHLAPISSGDLLRQEKASGSDLGKYIKENPQYNALVEIANELTRNKVKEAKGHAGFVMDGIRTILDAKTVDSILEDEGVHLHHVIQLDIQETSIFKRLCGRKIHAASGRVYGSDNPPKVPGIDDITGEKLEAREEDSTEAVNKRLNFYRNNITDLSRYYRDIYHVVNVERPVQEILGDIEQILKEPRKNTNRRDFEKIQEKPLDANLEGIAERASKISTVLVRSKITSLTRWKPGKFPGTHPLTIEKKNFDNFSREPYSIAIKADGVRYLLYLNHQEKKSFFVDRRYDAFEVSLPLSTWIEAAGDYLLDGEILKEEGEGGKSTVSFVIFDAIVVNGKNVKERDLQTRLDQVYLHFIKPLQKGEDPSEGKFKPRLQIYYDLKGVDEAFERSEKLGYKTDGLVFVPNRQGYPLGLNRSVFKWKSPEENTIDFSLQKVEDKYYGLFKLDSRSKGGDLVFHDYISPPEDSSKNLEDFVGKICECHWDPKKDTETPKGQTRGGWRINRIRTDKDSPNADWVISGIEKCIDEWITEDVMRKACKTETKSSSYNNSYGNSYRKHERTGDSYDRQNREGRSEGSSSKKRRW